MEIACHITIVSFLIGVFILFLKWKPKAHGLAHKDCLTTFYKLHDQILHSATVQNLVYLEQEVEEFAKDYAKEVQEGDLKAFTNELQDMIDNRHELLTIRRN